MPNFGSTPPKPELPARRGHELLEVGEDYAAYMRAVLRQAAMHPEHRPQHIIGKKK